MYHFLSQSVTLHFCIHVFRMILTVNGDYFLKHHQELIFVMVRCGVLFEVRTGFLNNI
jgi:hypothetical protein